MKNLVILFSLALCSCQYFEPQLPNDNTLLDGPIEGLSDEENRLFLLGDIAFNDEIFRVDNGLGPIFVATSCGSCHPGDGKGHPFTTLTRFGQTGLSGNLFLNQGGPQQQNRAIPGFLPETIPIGATSTKLTPPANTGLGFLDAVTDNDILSRADPMDVDGDGISGRVNWINLETYTQARPNSITNFGQFIGRFGKKASVYDLLQQTANAYNQDIGITSFFEPIDTYTNLEIDPEVSNETIHNVVFYLKTLKAPIPRQEDPEISLGKDIFMAIGCEKCHRAQWITGSSAISGLSNKTIYPYSDLLLHDMGPSLDDGYTEGSATTAEWRTPPLWGLGLSKNSQGGQYFLLHDGRAKSIEDAISLHGGEALGVRGNYQALSAVEKNALIKFLESL